jgi:hypothetical protein
MKKRRKNPHAVALGRLGGLVRSEAKRRANRENGRKGGQEPQKRELPPGETPDARGRGGAGRRGERGCRLDPGLFRPSGYRPGLWRDSLFGECTSLNPQRRMDSIERGQPVQLSFLCPCGKRIALKTLGRCRSCYDRGIVHYDSSVDSVSACWSGAASAVVVVASVRR